MGTLEEMGLFDQEKEVKKEDVKAALHSVEVSILSAITSAQHSLLYISS